MTRSIHFVMTGPPSLDVGSVVKVVDQDGRPIEVGWWQHDGTHWQYIMPVELVPRLIVPGGQVEPLLPSSSRRVDHSDIGVDKTMRVIAEKALAEIEKTDELTPAEIRRLRKEQIKNAKKKEKTMPSEDAVPAHWQACPGCQVKFDPAKDELMMCPGCGDDKSTACCLKNPVDLCLDCKALAANDKENGRVDMAVAPPSDTLFDGKFHADPKEIAAAKAQQAAGTLEIVEDDDDQGMPDVEDED